MSRLDSISGKVMDLVGQVGDNLRTALPDTAGKWLQTGAALGVAKTGSKAIGGLIRRNPAVAVAAAVGAGVAWYAVHRHRRKQLEEGGVIEGKAKRIEPRRAPRKAAKTSTRRAPRTRPTADE
ncbi:hypothetical protein FQY83_04450 [Luteimonas marina]|uniref:Uncharacterized protein n=1 Tax=Luteimonas marina TaxID=488485 RepID=A0A5C5U8N4_9GAMM|nr:hypothetical protein [Luteimonas marina]TWT22287.1 hypothetical protein FQY83_04450 [Luteimonas marina]